MAFINRQTLKNYFKKGGFATEKHFIDLIDSSVNTVDDGIAKSPEHGLKLSPIKEKFKLLSFFKRINQEKSDYSFNLDSNNSEGLSINNCNDATIMKFNKSGNVGINTDNPNYHLEINGTLGVKTRVGLYKSGTVPADGNWHYIERYLRGLSFRWTTGEMYNYGLQVKTRTNYGICSETKESFLIKYNITNLLDDE